MITKLKVLILSPLLPTRGPRGWTTSCSTKTLPINPSLPQPSVTPPTHPLPSIRQRILHLLPRPHRKTTTTITLHNPASWERSAVNQKNPIIHLGLILTKLQGPSKTSLPEIPHTDRLTTTMASVMLMMMFFSLGQPSTPVTHLSRTYFVTANRVGTY